MEQQKKTLNELIKEMGSIADEITERADEFADEEVNAETISTLHYLTIWSKSLEETLHGIVIHNAMREAQMKSGNFQTNLMKALDRLGFEPTMVPFGTPPTSDDE